MTKISENFEIRPLRIRHFFSNPMIGGAESFALSISPFWQRMGHDVTVVNLWNGGGGLKKACEKEGIPITLIDAGCRRFYLKAISKVHRFVQSDQVDINLVYGVRLQLLMRLIRSGCNTSQWITMLRGQNPWRKNWHSLLDRWTQGRFSCHVGCSREICRTWAVRERYHADRLFYIPNGIALSQYPQLPKKLQARAELNLPANAILAITVANLRPIKGHKFFLNSLAEIADWIRTTQLYFLWLGSDMGLWEKMRAQLSRMGLTDRVIYRGAVHNIPQYLEASDFFILPSESEGMPRALMEAMAASLPVVATNVGGTPDVLRDEVDGFLVDYGDKLTLADRIRKMVLSESIRKAMGKSARERIETTFDMETIAAEYVKLFWLMQNSSLGNMTHRLEAYQLKTPYSWINEE